MKGEQMMLYKRVAMPTKSVETAPSSPYKGVLTAIGDLIRGILPLAVILLVAAAAKTANAYNIPCGPVGSDVALPSDISTVFASCVAANNLFANTGQNATTFMVWGGPTTTEGYLQQYSQRCDVQSGISGAERAAYDTQAKKQLFAQQVNLASSDKPGFLAAANAGDPQQMALRMGLIVPPTNTPTSAPSTTSAPVVSPTPGPTTNQTNSAAPPAGPPTTSPSQNGPPTTSPPVGSTPAPAPVQVPPSTGGDNVNSSGDGPSLGTVGFGIVVAAGGVASAVGLARVLVINSYADLARAALALAPDSAKTAIKNYSGDPDDGFTVKGVESQSVDSFLIESASEEKKAQTIQCVNRLSGELETRLKGFFSRKFVNDKHAHGAAKTIVMSLLAVIGNMRAAEGSDSHRVDVGVHIPMKDGGPSEDTALSILEEAVNCVVSKDLTGAHTFLQTRLCRGDDNA